MIAVIFKRFGEVRASGAIGYGQRENMSIDHQGHMEGTVEFATFFIDEDLYALPAEHVLEAFPGSRVTVMSMGEREECIGVLALPEEVVWVFDLGYLIRGTPSVIDSSSQVLVARHGPHTIGLLVSELHGVPEFSLSEISPTPLASLSDGMLVPKVIKANGGRLLIQVVDVSCLFNMMKVGKETAT